MTPVARAVANSKLLAGDLAGMNVAYAQVKEGATHPVRVSQIEPVRIIVDEELEAVWAGKKTAGGALDTAATRQRAGADEVPHRANQLPQTCCKEEVIALPRLIAHRCGGNRAPENTLAGLHEAARGCQAVEFDVMLSADGTPVLIHDETLERTTNGVGRVCETPDAVLFALDAGRGERIPTLAEAAALCQRYGLLANIEIKPSAGHEAATGAVARFVQERWQGFRRCFPRSPPRPAGSVARGAGSAVRPPFEAVPPTGSASGTIGAVTCIARLTR